MNVEVFRDYCLSKKIVTEGFPFSKSPDTLVFKVAGKIFAVTNISNFESIVLKCNPELIHELKDEFSSVKNPPYFDGKHWISVLIDSSISDKKIFEWIDNSYDLIVSMLPKNARTKYAL